MAEVKKKVAAVCKNCSSYNHKSEECYLPEHVKCKTCQEHHLTQVHDFQAKLSCSISASVAVARMSLQDIKVSSSLGSSITARVLFDNGGHITLARNKFCQDAGFKYQSANYTLAGVGGKPQIYTAKKGGKIWTVVLRDNDGVVETVQAYGVTEVLLDTIGHGP